MDLCLCFRCLCLWKGDCHGVMIMENLTFEVYVVFCQVPVGSLFCYRLRRNLSILHFIDHDFVFFLRALAITVLSISSWGNQPNCPNLLSLRILTLHGPSLCKLKYIIFPCIDTKTLDFSFQYLFLDLDFLWKEIYSHNRIGIK